MLIESHADGFWVNFYDFSEGILESSGDGDGASVAGIEVWEFLLSFFGGGVDGGAGFVDDGIFDVREVVFLE